MNNVLQFLSDNLVVLLGAPCMLTFLLFAWDKSLAHFNSRQRVPEAVLIDTSDMTIDEVAQKVIELVKEEMAKDI